MRNHAYEMASSALSAAFWRKRKVTGRGFNHLLPVLFLAVALCFGQAAPVLAEAGTGTAASEDTELPETEISDAGMADLPEMKQEDAELSAVETTADNYRNYYEIFVYSFYDSDGDGIGDLNGVREKLDYIEEMGFDGIWLMPVMPSTTYHKYDVTDYYGIDEEYGTLEEFQALVEECHERGIKVVIDFVINHTSSQHEWFQEACAYLAALEDGEEPDENECPYVGYYHFSREQQSSSYYEIPTASGDAASTADAETDQEAAADEEAAKESAAELEDNVSGTEFAGSTWYYEGVFWSEMPDLDLSNEALRAELEEIAAYWINMGVDGFRMDAALHFEESDTAFNTEVLNWLYSYCLSLDPDFYMVSEVWANEATITDYYASGTPSMFNFDMAEAEGKLIKAARGTLKISSLMDSMLQWQEDFSAENADYIDAAFISNHDTGRISNALVSDENDMKMAAGLLMTMSGNTFVYYGEEIGMKSKGSADENKRLPMYWSDVDTEGMTNGPEDAEEGITSSFAAADEQLVDETSILNYYKRAIALRNENPEITRGTVEKVEELCDGNAKVSVSADLAADGGGSDESASESASEHADSIAAILKTWNDSTIAILYNTSDDVVDVDLTGTSLAGMEISGYLTLNGEEITFSEDTVRMPAQSILVLR
ncbi:MAG: alpha amylase [Lachnospiraceae bacterium]|nr:alpha amylase [Lachnospiraceae bacterium]